MRYVLEIEPPVDARCGGAHHLLARCDAPGVYPAVRGRSISVRGKVTEQWDLVWACNEHRNSFVRIEPVP